MKFTSLAGEHWKINHTIKILICNTSTEGWVSRGGGNGWKAGVGVGVGVWVLVDVVVGGKYISNYYIIKVYIFQIQYISNTIFLQ